MGCAASRSVAVQNQVVNGQSIETISAKNAPPPPNISTPSALKDQVVGITAIQSSLHDASVTDEDEEEARSGPSISSMGASDDMETRTTPEPAHNLTLDPEQGYKAVTSVRASSTIQHLQQALGFVTTHDPQGEPTKPKIDPFSVRPALAHQSAGSLLCTLCSLPRLRVTPTDTTSYIGCQSAGRMNGAESTAATTFTTLVHKYHNGDFLAATRLQWTCKACMFLENLRRLMMASDTNHKHQVPMPATAQRYFI
jgi:hypothetical protein